MKKLLSLVFIAPFVLQAQLNQKLAPYAEESVVDAKGQLSFIKFKTDHQVNEADVPQFINSMIFSNGPCKVQQNKVDRDNLGFSHTRYTVAYKGVAVFNKMIIAHCKDGKMTTLNGDLNEIKAPSNNFSLSEKSALSAALKKVNAKVYKWQVKAEEEHMRQALNQPDFTYYPKGEKVVFEKDGKFYYAYRFNIYAQEPLYRANVFVDASSGKVLAEQKLRLDRNKIQIVAQLDRRRRPFRVERKKSGQEPAVRKVPDQQHRRRDRNDRQQAHIRFPCTEKVNL